MAKKGSYFGVKMGIFPDYIPGSSGGLSLNRTCCLPSGSGLISDVVVLVEVEVVRVEVVVLVVAVFVVDQETTVLS
jgi:hypothetical protein